MHAVIHELGLFELSNVERDDHSPLHLYSAPLIALLRSGTSKRGSEGAREGGRERGRECYGGSERMSKKWRER